VGEVVNGPPFLHRETTSLPSPKTSRSLTS
jgi:hypothetical protein